MSAVNLTSYPQFYGHNWARPVARPVAKPYVHVRTRIAAPFLSAYATKPEPVGPAAPIEFAAAFAKILEAFQWVRSYVRKNGRVVAGYLRARPGRKAVA